MTFWSALFAAAAQALTPGLYTAATTAPHGLVQLEVRANDKGHVRRVISIHLPPAEIENLEVALTVTNEAVCLEPAPSAIEKCLKRTKGGLLATLKQNKTELLLVLRPSDGG